MNLNGVTQKVDLNKESQHANFNYQGKCQKI
jgi:hypothetical protein